MWSALTARWHDRSSYLKKPSNRLGPFASIRGNAEHLRFRHSRDTCLLQVDRGVRDYLIGLLRDR